MAPSGQLYLAWQAHQMNERGQAEIERKREAETGLGQKTLQNICPQISWQLRTVSIFSLFCLFQFVPKTQGLFSFGFWYLICIIMCCICFPYSYISVQLFISLSLYLCTVILQFFLLLYSFKSALSFRISLVLLSLDILLSSIN
jgi:hypothetical protein